MTPRNDIARSAPSRLRMAWLKRQLLTRLRRHFGGHAIVVRLAAARRLDVLAQHLFAAGERRGAPRRRALAVDHRPRALDGVITRALSRQHDLQTFPGRIGDDPGTVDGGQDRGTTCLSPMRAVGGPFALGVQLVQLDVAPVAL